MTDDSEELFRFLEKDLRRDRAVAIVRDLRETFGKYMTELAPSSIEEKADAAVAFNPSLDPVEAVRLANIYAAADGIMTAVAVYLARSQP